MAHGVGIDIIEVSRIEKLISSSNRFKQRIYTQREVDYCEARKNKAQNYAARFAAKEAFLKAIGTGWRSGVAFREIEVLNNEQGKPEIHLHGHTKKIVQEIHIKSTQLSLSHIKEIAVAVVVVEA
jgi:holo-[acyl-carrier protein] synthase